MVISSEYLEIIEKITESVNIPKIREVIVPLLEGDLKKSNFATIILEDNTAGIFYISLNPQVKDHFLKIDSKRYQGADPTILAQKFTSKELHEKSLGLGCVNAISQHLFRKSNFSFDYTSDSMGLLDIGSSDIVGMVGFFPPLVKLIEKMANRLIVIEKKEHLVKRMENWVVTLDPSLLNECNKVLITSTTVLNESIDDILTHCSSAKKISMLGPTAGFLPDPLFKRGIDVIGGSVVENTDLLIHSIKKNIPWGSSVNKYTIMKKKYLGYKKLLKEI